MRLVVAVVIALVGMVSSRPTCADEFAHPVGARPEPARVVFLDDGEKITRDARRPLGDGPWPAGRIDLFALGGESLALQVVVEAGRAAVEGVRVLVEPFLAPDGARLPVTTELFVERFIDVLRPTGNDSDGSSLAFSSKSAPSPPLLGPIADPLVPEALETARAAPHERAAIWIDLTVPSAARAGSYRATVLVRDAKGELAARPIELRVIGDELPFAAAPAFVYYDTGELARRMGDVRAELQLRQLFHAHHLAAVHELATEREADPRAVATDRAALTGTAFTAAGGYEGPGEGIGEGVLALGTYGSLGAPTRTARDVAANLAHALFGDRGPEGTAAFVYAVDESCASDWPARWSDLLRDYAPLRGFRVGATCGDEPSAQAADLVLQTARDFDPARAHRAEHDGKWVWAYNGIRPWAGPLVLDVPATDLRANAWIAMRYGVRRWFYWEATFWFDDNGGGRGGETGFDPFVVAETFHDADGDHSNGDGLLVYPGEQRARGMVDYGVSRLFPSIRLKNLRRGIEDAGYVALARAVDRDRTDAVVARVIPRALAWAGERPSWPQDARSWLGARRELVDILALRGSRAVTATPTAFEGEGEAVSESCAIGQSSVRAKSAPPFHALFLIGVITLGVRAFIRTEKRVERVEKARAVANRKRDEAIPSTKPGHRLATARGGRPPAGRIAEPRANEPRANDSRASQDAARKRSEMPTLPPPPATPRRSGMRAKRKSISPSATVDEVVADLSRDPRREDED
jgi:hypothetical protein